MATELDTSIEEERCSACAAPTAAGWAVCIYCGVVLRQERLELGECIACRSILMGWQQYCMRCGSPVGSGPTAKALPVPTPRVSSQPAGVSIPPEAEEEPVLELLAGIRRFLVSKMGAATGAALLLLAVAPWFFQGDQVIVRLIVPASGQTVEKAVGDVLRIEAVALNAEAGGVLTVSVDGQPLPGFPVGSTTQERPELTWEVPGPVGALHEFTVELRSSDGGSTLGEPATVLVVASS